MIMSADAERDILTVRPGSEVVATHVAWLRVVGYLVSHKACITGHFLESLVAIRLGIVVWCRRTAVDLA